MYIPTKDKELEQVPTKNEREHGRFCSWGEGICVEKEPGDEEKGLGWEV